MILLLGACTQVRKDEPVTIGSLNDRVIPLEDDVVIENGRDKAIEGYRQILEASTDKSATPQAMRRLADLQVERGETSLGSSEPQVQHESDDTIDLEDYQQSIKIYEDLLRTYPDYPEADRVVYQLSKAYEYAGQNEKAMQTLDRMVSQFPNSANYVEAQFRRGEILFVDKQFSAAEQAYQAVLDAGDKSPFYEHALYKKGWTRFKQGQYEGAVDEFIKLFDNKLSSDNAISELAALPRAERELLDDAIRAMGLGFAYQAGSVSVVEYFDNHGRRPYEVLVYQQLGDMFLSNERFSDAAETYRSFVDKTPNHPAAPEFQMKVIDAYQKGNFPTEVLTAKKEFVERYQLTDAYWQQHDTEQSEQVLVALKKNLTDLAQYYHSKAQASKKQQDYQEAATWYRAFLESFPQDPQAAGMNFLLAEVLFETKNYKDAAPEYERTAYQYPQHDKAAEAAYGALVAHREHEKTLKDTDQGAMEKLSIQSGLNFADTFSGDLKAAAVLTTVSEELFKRNEFKLALDAAGKMLEKYPDAKPELRQTAWTVVAHSAFDTQDYVRAETAYQQILEQFTAQDERRPKLEERLAAAIYKQGEVARQGGDLATAVDHFIRVGQVLPASPMRATAEYDAAAALIEMQDWPRAANVLEDFRGRYPDHKFQPEVTRKLAVVYQQSGQGLKAAQEFEHIGRQVDGDQQLRREALTQSAELYIQGDDGARAIPVYEQYVKDFPSPAEQAVEIRQKLADLYANAGEAKKQYHWLDEIIIADKGAGSERSDRTRFLAANAALTLAEPAAKEYQNAKLEVPLKKSLKKKKGLMEKALDAYGKAADYEIEKVTTASTYQIARIYHDFGEALMGSERPKGLSGEELEQYDILLEEQAYPFEEKAIEIYEVNAKRTASGIYDDWVKKSITSLAELMPARYAKQERSESVVEAIW